MRIGISPFGTSRETVLAVAEQAVTGGIDTLWLGDGYLTNPDFPGWAGGMESMIELAWLAGRFPSARVAIGAAVLGIRDVPWLAKQANSVVRMAGGGFVLVVAAGYWPRELEARGRSFQGRGAVFEELLAELRAALADPGLAPGPPADGPPPSGPVPVWLAGAAPTMGRALRLGLPFQASRATPDELAPVAARWFAGGGGLLAHRVRMEVGTHKVAGHEVSWHAVTGSPDRLVDAMGRYAEMGVADLSILPGQDDHSARRTVDALVSDVLPQLR